MALFKPFRGNRASLDSQEKHDGYAYFCTDDGSFHIDYVDENGALQRKQITAPEQPKNYTLLTDTVTGAIYKVYIANSKLMMEVNE